MAFNWALAAEIAAESLVVTAASAPAIGGPDHIAGAQEALQSANLVASSVITDPAQQAEAAAATAAAGALLKLFALIFHKK